MNDTPERSTLPADSPRSKRQNVLSAATSLFLREGYSRTSMDAVAAEAGVSKATIYNHFPGKEALFEAIVRDRCETLLAPLRRDNGAEDGLETTLRSVARQCLDVVLDPSCLSLHRVLIAESSRDPDLGRLSYRIGAAVAVEHLAAFLRQHVARGTLRIDDPALAAEQFFGALIGHTQLRALLCVEGRPPSAELDRFADAAVGVFLRAYAS